MIAKKMLYMRRLPQSSAQLPVELRQDKLPVTQQKLEENLLSFSRQQKEGIFSPADHRIFVEDLKAVAPEFLGTYAAHCLTADVALEFYEDFLQAMGRKEFCQAMDKNLILSTGWSEDLVRLFKFHHVLTRYDLSRFAQKAKEILFFQSTKPQKIKKDEKDGKI